VLQSRQRGHGLFFGLAEGTAGLTRKAGPETKKNRPAAEATGRSKRVNKNKPAI